MIGSLEITRLWAPKIVVSREAYRMHQLNFTYLTASL